MMYLKTSTIRLVCLKMRLLSLDTQLQSYANTVVSLDVVRDTLKKTIAKNEVKAKSDHGIC